jgi:hypothetical protein
MQDAPNDLRVPMASPVKRESIEEEEEFWKTPQN